MATVANKNAVLASKRYAKRSQFAQIWRRLKKNKGAIFGLILIIVIISTAILSNIFMDYENTVIGQNVSERLQFPSLQHICGTDDLGRDVFSRLLYGAKFSLSVGVIAVGISLIFGVTLGAVAGYSGGLTEDVIMRCADVLSSVPHILMAIAIVAALGKSTLNLMIAVGIASIPEFVRVTRAAVLTVRNQEYIEAAKATGLPEWKIILVHILPNCLSPIIVQSTLRVASAIISASALSFLGLGVPAPAPEWGSMLSAGRKFIRGYGYLTLFPGIAIMVTVLSLNLLGDGLRDALDPKLKK